METEHPRRRLLPCVLSATWLAFAGCSESIPSWDVLRLGPEGDRTRIGREVRQAFSARGVKPIPLPEREDCSLHVGYGVVGKRATGEFEVALVDGDGSRELLHRGRPLGPGMRWTDFRAELPTTEGYQLSLGASEAVGAGGVWSRPYLSCRADSKTAARPRYNVILVSLDTLRADRIGAYGNAHGLTPNLDRFAAQGTTFEHAYTHFPNTLGSHASLFTGRYPSQHGLKTSYREALGPEVATLARAFEASGFATAAFTENAYVSSGFGFSYGFDRYHEGSKRGADRDFSGESVATFKRGIEWLEQRPRAPFFLFLHTYEVHSPYTPSPRRLAELMKARGVRYQGRFEKALGELFEIAYNAGNLELSQDDHAQIERLYDAEVRTLDSALGNLLKALKRFELEESTLVVLLADHGEEMNEHGLLGHGESLYEEVMRVPLIFRLPGIPSGKRIEPRIGLIDVAPTIAELAGIDPPFAPGPQRSRVNWILGETDASQAGPVFGELNRSTSACQGEERGSFNTCTADIVSIRDAEFSYVHVGRNDEEMLFRFPEDRYEQEDLSGALPEVTARYRKLADEYRAHMSARSPATGAAEIDEDTREKLKSLGYAE